MFLKSKEKEKGERSLIFGKIPYLVSSLIACDTCNWAPRDFLVSSRLNAKRCTSSESARKMVPPFKSACKTVHIIKVCTQKWCTSSKSARKMMQAPQVCTQNDARLLQSCKPFGARFLGLHAKRCMSSFEVACKMVHALRVCMQNGAPRTPGSTSLSKTAQKIPSP